MKMKIGIITDTSIHSGIDEFGKIVMKDHKYQLI